MNIHLYHILFLSLIKNVRSEADQNEISEFRKNIPFGTQQLQLLSLYNNLNFCLRDADSDLKTASENFDPLKNLNLYKNPDTVKLYFENLKAGKYGKLFQPFFFNEAILSESKVFLAVLWPIKDWELFFNTTAYASQKVNKQMLFWALNVLFPSKWRHFKSPGFFEVFPQIITDKFIIRKANGNALPNATVKKEGPENVLKYWRNDVALNHFHFEWHANYPSWFEGVGFTKDRKEELFIYIHHNIMNRYKAERLSLKMSDVSSLELKKPIPIGDIPLVLNANLSELPSRKRNSSIVSCGTTTVNEIVVSLERLRQGISDGYLITPSGSHVSLRNDSGINYFGATMWASSESINTEYYEKLHANLHCSISEIDERNSNNPGVEVFEMQAMTDPVFFMLHGLIDTLNKQLQHKLKPYTKRELEFPTMNLKSIRIVTMDSSGLGFLTRIPVLKTFFEKFTYDISNSLASCQKVNSGKKYTTTVRRLNYEPFEYKIIAYNRGGTGSRGIVRIFMAPVNGFDGKRYSRQDLYWNMFEMDRFPLTFKHGRNVITRSSMDSSVARQTPQGIQELRQEVRMMLAKTGKLPRYPLNETRNCGWPQNLLLPRGTEEGMHFKLFAMISSNSTGDYDENIICKLPYCANPNGKYPDGVPMGFPFNRRYPAGNSVELEDLRNSAFITLIIKHEMRNF